MSTIVSAGVFRGPGTNCWASPNTRLDSWYWSKAARGGFSERGVTGGSGVSEGSAGRHSQAPSRMASLK